MKNPIALQEHEINRQCPWTLHTACTLAPGTASVRPRTLNANGLGPHVY